MLFRSFSDGRQASFVHSDLAAARKPKFYVLGTEGAIVADWNPDGEPAVADLPALISVHDANGVATQVPLDDVPQFLFHRELVAYLTDGTPMQVSPLQSRNVVAVMEAAEASAEQMGRPVQPQLVS